MKMLEITIGQRKAWYFFGNTSFFYNLKKNDYFSIFSDLLIFEKKNQKKINWRRKNFSMRFIKSWQ